MCVAFAVRVVFALLEFTIDYLIAGGNATPIVSLYVIVANTGAQSHVLYSTMLIFDALPILFVVYTSE